MSLYNLIKILMKGGYNTAILAVLLQTCAKRKPIIKFNFVCCSRKENCYKKKTICVLLCFILVFVLASPAFAESISIYPDIIEMYFTNINNGNYASIIRLLSESQRSEFEEFVTDPNNFEGKIGIFNYSSVDVLSCQIYDGSEQLDVFFEDTADFANVEYWGCTVNATAYRETKYLSSGINRFIICTGLDDTNAQVIIGIIRITGQNQIEVNDVSPLSYDAPVSAPTSGVWTTPSTINVQGYGNVNFKTYCYRVTANEFGSDNLNQTARKAVALAVKNFGWNRTLVQKYPNYEYDVKATNSDQVYSESVEITSNVTNAVNAIWNYVMLSCDYKLFCGFHLQNSSKGSGILSQLGANELAESGYTWQQILHEYYDYGTYNTEMTKGVIKIVNLSHSQSGTYSINNTDILYHWIVCTVCGCTHTKSIHTWVETNGKYQCSVCKRIETEAPPTIIEKIAGEEYEK